MKVNFRIDDDIKVSVITSALNDLSPEIRIEFHKLLQHFNVSEAWNEIIDFMRSHDISRHYHWGALYIGIPDLFNVLNSCLEFPDQDMRDLFVGELVSMMQGINDNYLENWANLDRVCLLANPELKSETVEEEEEPSSITVFDMVQHNYSEKLSKIIDLIKEVTEMKANHIIVYDADESPNEVFRLYEDVRSKVNRSLYAVVNEVFPIKNINIENTISLELMRKLIHGEPNEVDILAWPSIFLVSKETLSYYNFFLSSTYGDPCYISVLASLDVEQAKLVSAILNSTLAKKGIL